MVDGIGIAARSKDAKFCSVEEDEKHESRLVCGRKGPQTVNCFLVIALIQFSQPMCRSANLAALANQQVTTPKCKTNPVRWRKIHLGEIVSVYSSPLNINI